MYYAINVKYEYVTNTATPGYFCLTVDLVITEPGVKITSFNGVHAFDMTDSDVLEYNTTKQNTDYLPHGLAEKFVNLEIVYVIDSGLKAITRNDFESLTKLKEIALYGNQINEIPANCFDDLINLRKLSLSNNRIKYLPNEVFHRLPNLNEVYISRNKLEALPSNLFENNPHMLRISLSVNSLKSIGDRIVINLKKLKSVSLEDNTCINDSFPKSSLKTMSNKIKEQCSVEDLCLHTRIEVNTEVQELNRKIEKCENDKTELETRQVSFMVLISNYEKTRYENSKMLEFLEAENLFLRDENEHFKQNDETTVHDLQKVVSSLKEDILSIENGSREDRSKMEEQILSLIEVNLKQEETENNLRSQITQMKQLIKNLKAEIVSKRPTKLQSNIVELHKFIENDQNKPSTNANDDTNAKKSKIDLIFHHKG